MYTAAKVASVHYNNETWVFFWDAGTATLHFVKGNYTATTPGYAKQQVLVGGRPILLTQNGTENPLAAVVWTPLNQVSVHVN